MGAFASMFFKRKPFDDTDPSMPDMGATVPGSTGSASSALSPSRPSPTLQGTQEYQDFADTGAKLRAALQPNPVSAPRAMLGALFARRNPMLASVITGDFQRQHQIQPLEKQYELLGNMISQNRAMHTADINDQMHQAETGYYNAHSASITNPPLKPKEEEWSIAPNVLGPNGEPVQIEKTSGQMRISPLGGASLKDPADTKGGQLTDIDIGGQNHKVLVNPKDGTIIRDLGQSKLPNNSGNEGTWTLDEDADGKPILFNSKTGQTRQAPAGIARPGTKSKADAATEKLIGPARDAQQYANDYLANGRFTGAGDEALQEKFFELAKPTTGFRMTQPQIDMLQHSRDWMSGAQARFRHATQGTWFNDTQRKQIVQTMQDLADAKIKGQKGAGSQSQGGKPPDGATHIVPGPDGKNHYTNAQGTVDLGVAP
jgi:hypothetical protein